MISEDDLMALSAITIAEAPISDEQSKRESFITSVLIGLLVKLLVEYIYRNCIQTRRLGYNDVRNLPFFRKLRLRAIIRDLCHHPSMKEAWENYERQGPPMIGKIRVKSEYNPTLTFHETRDEVARIAMLVGEKMKREDFD